MPEKRKGKKYPILSDGEGFELEPLRKNSRGFQLLKLACCDCNLVHIIAFAIEKNGNLGVALKRDNRATAALRRKKKKC
jgi:hypothetical protein